jgi:pimeloyl-ACP methyl ester carboxylesterase
VLTEADVRLADGRTLHYYDVRVDDPRLTVFWHHGSPNVGEPPAPLLPASAERGVRWVSYDRPGYGGSTANPGRTVGSAAGDVAAVADALGIDRFAVMGHSGGGAHALACAALLPDRVTATVCGSGLAPTTADGLDWFAGFAPGGAAELRAAREGPKALAAYLETSEFDPETFTPADHAALGGDWSWLMTVVDKAMAGGQGGFIDDDVATVTPWGFDPDDIATPVLYLHGARDRMVPSTHSQWLAKHTPSAELWLLPDEGHISVLRSGVAALDWLLQRG